VKVYKRFPLQVAITFVAGLAIAAIPLMKLGSREIVVAVIVGAVMSTVNALAGFLAIEYSLEKSYTTFLQAVLGGMGIRMVVMLGTLVLLIKLAGFHAVGLVVSVLSFYVIYLVLEIFYIQKKVSHKNQS
jgi:hypothetical protein